MLFACYAKTAPSLNFLALKEARWKIDSEQVFEPQTEQTRLCNTVEITQNIALLRRYSTFYIIVSLCCVILILFYRCPRFIRLKT